MDATQRRLRPTAFEDMGRKTQLQLPPKMLLLPTLLEVAQLPASLREHRLVELLGPSTVKVA